MDGPTARAAAVSIGVIAATVLLIHAFASASLSSNNPDAPQYVTGLVNIGNTCFMNAVLQALASLPSLRSYLEARKDIGHPQDSVTLALCETIEMLSTIHRRPTSKRLVRMVSTVKAKAAHVLTSQQQDAQELFQIISSQLSEEREKLDHPGTPSLFDRTTMGDFMNVPSSPSSPSSSSSQSVGLRRKASLPVLSSSLSLSQISSLSREEMNSSSALKCDSNASSEKNKDKAESVEMTASLILDKSEQEKFSRAKSPFMGLLASRVSCVDCGYTAAIRHSTFDNLSLTVPLQYSCSLEDCLDSFINLDTITDFNCRKCTVMSASKDLEQKIEQGKKALADIEKRQSNSDGTDSIHSENGHGQGQGETNGDIKLANGNSTKRRSSAEPTTKSKISLADMERLKEQVDQCLANNIEMDLSPLELTPVRSKKTTKNSMIAKPPQALCLHLNRSMFTGAGQMAKNPCRVIFGERLDFTRFTTSGHLTMVATKSMSRRGSITNSIHGAVDPNHSFRTELGLGIGANMVAGTGSGTTSMFPRRGSINHMSMSSPLTSNSLSSSIRPASMHMIEREPGSPGEELNEDRVIYRLWAVIVHLGSHNSGHFVTYRRIPTSSRSSTPPNQSKDDVDDIAFSASSGKWWRISDEDVQIVDWSLVKSAEAYMLFFEKE
ncbi:hypothetical protein BGX27_004837 [Mortierella sp. AM989]|nr:hypothetical protein BGX27_004837 [Mortierella sp. AM989]